jgi:molybdenum cofactor cytidylyltransferase
MTFAVIPAAGHSTRMGRPKLALPLGGRTVIEHLITALRSGGCEHVVVVVGTHVPELVALAESAAAHPCLLADQTPDMRATIEHGLLWLENTYHPRPDAPWFLVPGDHAMLEPGIVRLLLNEYSRGSHSIVVPSLNGRRGHPTLLAWRHVDGIRRHPRDGGINAYLRSCASETREMEVLSENVLVDLNTPADYERLQARFEASGNLGVSRGLG